MFAIIVNTLAVTYMNIGMIIAVNLKILRTERNLTLGQLSKISGVSKAMLSDIEKDSIVIKRNDISVQTDDHEHYRIYCYFKNTPVRIFLC